MVVDVKKAYFFADAVREVYVELPAEERGDGSEVGLLKKSLYGTRDAALNWANAYSRVLVDKLGFRKGASSPCSFWHEGRGLRLAVHGDDFVVEGSRAELLALKDDLAAEFEIKWELLGRDEGEVRQLRLLNRVLTMEDDCLTWEADPRHIEVLVDTLGLHGKKGLSVPGVADGTESHEKKKKGCCKATLREADGGDAAGDEGEHDGDAVADLVLDTGDRVKVTGHGDGLITGKSCCGFQGCYEVRYDDGTRFHCNPGDVVKKVEPMSGMLRCRGCGSWQVS